jgi:hypothetical protein
VIYKQTGVDRPIGKKGFSLWAFALYYVGGPLDTINIFMKIYYFFFIVKLFKLN